MKHLLLLTTKLCLSLIVTVGIAIARPSDNYKIVIKDKIVHFKSSNKNLESKMVELIKDEVIKRKFGRGFMKAGKGQFEYIYCVVTNLRKIWCFGSTGKIKITDLGVEIYL